MRLYGGYIWARIVPPRPEQKTDGRSENLALHRTALMKIQWTRPNEDEPIYAAGLPIGATKSPTAYPTSMKLKN